MTTGQKLLGERLKSATLNVTAPILRLGSICDFILVVICLCLSMVGQIAMATIVGRHCFRCVDEALAYTSVVLVFGEQQSQVAITTLAIFVQMRPMNEIHSLVDKTCSNAF